MQYKVARLYRSTGEFMDESSAEVWSEFMTNLSAEGWEVLSFSEALCALRSSSSYQTVFTCLCRKQEE